MSRIISVIGPTASGKTRLSVALAKHFNGEIVSVDSMQIYRKMDIGTAKVTASEMQGIPHHMIDRFEPSESCNVQKFIGMARSAVDDITARGKTCVLAGGTGLYVDHLIQDTQFVDIPADEQLRNKLNGLSQTELAEQLSKFDREASDRLHPNDKKRIVRALEVYMLTGKSILHWERLSHVGSRPLNVIMLGLNFSDRSKLYDRINQRVDQMVEDGLEQEVRSLAATEGFIGSTAAEAIGYKEMLRYFDGSISFETAVESIKQSTRRYAKRQITWFKRNPAIHWIDITHDTNFEDIRQQAIQIVERNSK